MADCFELMHQPSKCKMQLRCIHGNAVLLTTHSRWMHNVTPARIIFKEGNEQLPPAEHCRLAAPGSLPVILAGHKPNNMESWFLFYHSFTLKSTYLQTRCTVSLISHNIASLHHKPCNETLSEQLMPGC